MQLQKRKTTIQTIVQIAYGGIIGMCIVATGLIVFNHSGRDRGERFSFLSVQSGSMEPAIPVGGLVISKLTSVYSIGSVITYTDQTYNVLITHRVVDVSSDDLGVYYITKGDANDAPDTQKVRPSQIQGKVLLSVPVVGYVMQFVRTRVGFMLIVLTPALFLILHELSIIVTELKQLSTSRSFRFRRYTVTILKE